jgi:hypothetical protein
MDSVRAISNASVQQTPGFSQEQAARLQAVRLQQTPQTTVSIAPQAAMNEDLPFILYAAAAPAWLTMKLADASDKFMGRDKSAVQANRLNIVA